MQAYSANDGIKDERREESLLIEMEIDLKDERWAQSLEKNTTQFYMDES